jgi:hypothetical protein
MKSFLIVFKNSLPVGLGIVMALISIAFAVNITDGAGSDDIIATIFFGVIGFPMLIAGALKLTKDLDEK